MSATLPKRSKKKIIELSTSMSVIEEIVAAAAANDNAAESADIAAIAAAAAATAKKSRGRKSKVMTPATLAASQKSAAVAPTSSGPQPVLPVSNVILQLKCCLKDLRDYNSQYNNCMTNITEYNPNIPPPIKTYNEEDAMHFYQYEKSARIDKENTDIQVMEPDEQPNNIDCSVGSAATAAGAICPRCSTDTEVKVRQSAGLQQKIKKLKLQMYKSVYEGKQSACFWCTHDFDTPACFIPKYETEESMHGYGSFCSPNCAAAYLLNENINDSIRFERYSLLNWLYSNVDDNTVVVSIHPAPNPYYTLQRYYGNLTIEEYRRLTQTDQHRLIVLDRPLTRILPELHEDTTRQTTQQQHTTTTTAITATTEEKKNMGMGGFRVRKESEKSMRASKADIVRDRFGLSAK
jgi:hypothetical protein